MKKFGLGSYAMSGGVAIALLAGCGESYPPIGGAGVIPQNTNERQPDGDATRSTLLYVSDPEPAPLHSIHTRN